MVKKKTRGFNPMNAIGGWLVNIDEVLIQFYRLTGLTFLDYLLGTFILALISVILGELTISLALRYNKIHVNTITDDMVKMNNLSIMALKHRDKKSYKACNDTANDAFGKYFFNMIAYSASSLWPAFFALAWMQTRFSQVEFPLPYPVETILPTIGYFPTFLLCYILARILFKNIRRYLPYFSTVQKQLDAADKEKSERMMTFSDLMPEKSEGVRN
ncbi:MAG: hypothetical protein LJE89_15120 [Deltaproteobacteria bacterium]|nr:hypothetical protein [Deltaproteobacteria bacterium]